MKQLLGFVLMLLVLPVTAAPDATWHQAPVLIRAGERPLDTYFVDDGGHAAPFLADLDGDGRRDLIVGSIRGYFHFYKNIGTDAAPRFTGQSTRLKAWMGEPARIPNFCCVAAGPQLHDIDGDGVLDLTAGSYSPGAVYWFKGRSDGSFHARHMLTDIIGRPVLPVTEVNPYEIGSNPGANLAVNLAWTYWDENDSVDMLLGNGSGQLFVRLNGAGVIRDTTSMPIASQPQFMPKVFQKFNEITIDGDKAVPGGHAAPSVVDWDGDGLWDIVSGSMRGEVYWLRNTGKPGAPIFQQREILLPAGESLQWVNAGEAPGRGVRTQIHAVDYNLDGKMDLLVGDWSVVRSQRPDLTRAEKRNMERVLKALEMLDAQVDYRDVQGASRYKHQKYYNNPPLLKQAQALEKQLTHFLVRFDMQELPDYRIVHGYQRATGQVWLYLGM